MNVILYPTIFQRQESKKADDMQDRGGIGTIK